MTTLSQFKENLLDEAKDLEKLLDRGYNTAGNISRLEVVEEMLEIIGKNEKMDSIFKQSLKGGGSIGPKAQAYPRKKLRRE